LKVGIAGIKSGVSISKSIAIFNNVSVSILFNVANKSILFFKSFIIIKFGSSSKTILIY
jgi:allophanate hydrolase subunit 1